MAMHDRESASLWRLLKRGTMAQPDGLGGSVLWALA